MQLAMINSGAWSKINWTQVIGVAASAVAIFGVHLDAETQVKVVTAIQVIQAGVTWFMRTFLTAKPAVEEMSNIAAAAAARPVEELAVISAADRIGIDIKT